MSRCTVLSLFALGGGSLFRRQTAAGCDPQLTRSANPASGAPGRPVAAAASTSVVAGLRPCAQLADRARRESVRGRPACSPGTRGRISPTTGLEPRIGGSDCSLESSDFVVTKKAPIQRLRPGLHQDERNVLHVDYSIRRGRRYGSTKLIKVCHVISPQHWKIAAFPVGSSVRRRECSGTLRRYFPSHRAGIIGTVRLIARVITRTFATMYASSSDGIFDRRRTARYRRECRHGLPGILQRPRGTGATSSLYRVTM